MRFDIEVCRTCGRPVGPMETVKICSVEGGDTCKFVKEATEIRGVAEKLLETLGRLCAQLLAEPGYMDPESQMELRRAVDSLSRIGSELGLGTSPLAGGSVTSSVSPSTSGTGSGV